jgi:membrane protein DedA with SNARE-associated domain
MAFDVTPILNQVTAYGPPALTVLLVLGIVGLPVPDETLLVFCGYLVYSGHFSFPSIWIAAAAGSLMGISISYILGRTLGLAVIHRYGKRLGATEERLEKVHQWLKGVGHWGLAFGYFIPGVRHFTAVVAGATGLEYRIFATYAYTGGIFWVTVFLLLGYFLGESWQRVSENAHHVLLYGSIGLGAALGCYLLWRRRRAR